jgi:hypothetical protein
MSEGDQVVVIATTGGALAEVIVTIEGAPGVA